MERRGTGPYDGRSAGGDHFYHRQHRATVLAEKLAAVEAELRSRNLSSVSTQGLYALSSSLQRQIEAAIGDLSFVSPVKDIPGDEYVEEVQQWNP